MFLWLHPRKLTFCAPEMSNNGRSRNTGGKLILFYHALARVNLYHRLLFLYKVTKLIDQSIVPGRSGYIHSIITVRTMFSAYEHFIQIKRTVSCTTPSKPKLPRLAQSISKDTLPSRIRRNLPQYVTLFRHVPISNAPSVRQLKPVTTVLMMLNGIQTRVTLYTYMVTSPPSPIPPSKLLPEELEREMTSYALNERSMRAPASGNLLTGTTSMIPSLDTIDFTLPTSIPEPSLEPRRVPFSCFMAPPELENPEPPSTSTECSPSPLPMEPNGWMDTTPQDMTWLCSMSSTQASLLPNFFESVTSTQCSTPPREDS